MPNKKQNWEYGIAVAVPYFSCHNRADKKNEEAAGSKIRKKEP
ncbi:MAG: hypothetical protein PUD93_11515 [Lachnospiraceae bacterium]|nr:hypothetical protein [Lachnospiraceae bacterium]